ncbi:hypothetical protein QK292_14610 [Arthrobacter sp. AL08]|uniref:hypothetical protein n=1 Tax=unclassified Arthrobacter TaxID=235627 RepID=UPI00249A6C85|nr:MULTISPECIES: hypothetical protein [unclassified Arthrobacter]MDI3242784.1 hypothetical protein [Arthrobacter sp. AL05]MDI3278795.1 hypothetical protein [Arthrobacter sp. AL08]
MAERGLADVAARLYALPFDDFVPARTAAAKAAGATNTKNSLAADVRALPKPSLAAWSVNMLATRRPETLRQLAELGESMRAAQSSLDATTLRRLGQTRRRLLAGAVQAARDVAQQQGRTISGATAADVEGTLRAATADEGAAAAVQSGRLLRGLSADGVDAVDLSDAVALPGLVPPATPAPDSAPAPGGESSRTGVLTSDAAPAGATAPQAAGRPRLQAVREEPRRPSPSAQERARAALKEAENTASVAADEARQRDAELAQSTALVTELSDTARDLREQLARCEPELKAARKRRDLAAAQAQQADRAAGRARRAEDLARERVLRIGNTPD